MNECIIGAGLGSVLRLHIGIDTQSEIGHADRHDQEHGDDNGELDRRDAAPVPAQGIRARVEQSSHAAASKSAAVPHRNHPASMVLIPIGRVPSSWQFTARLLPPPPKLTVSPITWVQLVEVPCPPD